MIQTERTQKMFPLFALAFVLGMLFGLLVTLPDFLTLKRELQKTVDYIANQKAGETMLMDITATGTVQPMCGENEKGKFNISPTWISPNLPILWIVPGHVIPKTVNDAPGARYAWQDKDSKIGDWKPAEKLK